MDVREIIRGIKQAYKPDGGGMNMRSAYSLKNESGLTFIELLVMALVVSMILIAIPASFRSGTGIWDKGRRHNEMLQNALVGMEDLTRELRQAKDIRAISPSGASNGYIDFRYKDDIDGDGDKEYRYQKYEYNGTEDYLQYAWSSNEATDLSSNTHLLAGPVNSFTLTSYKGYSLDGEGNMVEQQATLPDEIDKIRSVRIKMITYDGEGKVNPIPLSARVYLRTWGQQFVTNNFAIFGDDGVDLGDQPLYIGFYVDPSNIGAKDGIYVGSHTTINGDVHHASGGEFTEGNQDVILNGEDYGADEYVLMPCVADFNDPQWWGEAAPPDSQGSVTVSQSEEISLYSGVYDDLDMANNSVLNLSAGTYRFSSITADNGVSLNIDASGGDVRVFVDGICVFGNAFQIIPIDGGGAENIYFETHYVQNYNVNPADDPAWAMGQNAFWLGTIYAPYGDINVTDGIISGQLLSGGSISVHGGDAGPIGAPINETMVDFVLSNHMDGYGYACFDEL